MTRAVPPGAAGPVPSWDPTPPATAGGLSQVLVLMTAGLALWLATSLADAPHVGIVGAAVLAGSVALGLTTPAHRILGPLPGLVAGVLAVVALSFVSAFVGPVVGTAWLWVIFCVPLVLTGLDWQRVGRLQAVVAVATLVVIPLAAAERSGNLATVLGWLVLAAASMWSLEQDRRRGEARPQPLVPGAGDADPNAGDLLRTVALAVAIGVVAALLVSVPSCNLPFRVPGLHGPPRTVAVRPGEPGRGEPTDGSGRTTIVDGTRSDGSGEGSGQAARDRRSGPRLSAWWLLALAAVAALAAWLWWRRGRTPPGGSPDREWALALVEQIDAAGRARGRPRDDATTVRHHTDDLAASVLPDERLATVGRVLDGALFGHAPVDARTRLWAESVVDEVVEAHPAPRRPHR